MRYFSYNMMYYRISKNEKILFFGKKNRPGVGSDLNHISIFALTFESRKPLYQNQKNKSIGLALLLVLLNRIEHNFIENYTSQATHRWRRRLTHTCYVENIVHDRKLTFKVTAHTWAIFFPKNRIFSFFDIL